MILSDFHCHTTFVDGKSTPEEMVLAAIEKGMHTLGVSEHAHVPFDPHCSLSLDDTPMYREEIKRLKEKYKDRINLLCGIEMDYYSVDDPLAYDYVIGSVHYLKVGDEIYCVDLSPEETKRCIMNGFGGDLYQYANATTVPAIRKSDLESIPFPLAPYDTQVKIVNYIESLFAKLDEAKEKAQDVVDGFGTRKAAILHKAFSGELTAKWREEEGLIFTKEEIALEELCYKIKDGFHNSPKPVTNGYPYIMAGDVQESGINFDNGLYMDEKNHRELYKKAFPQKGDILMVNIGASTGRSAIIDVDFEFSFKNCAILKLKKEKVIPKYILYYLWSQKERLLKEITQGGAQPFLSLKIIKNINIPIVEYSEQKEIVKLLEGLLLKEQQAKETAEAVIEQIDTMKKAILARAFRGKLGTNVPNEESAVELLKQIISTL